MSKGNMLLGFARGKVGSLVFSRNNGQQVTRAKADTIKNPKTRAQFIQRIILNTIAQAYSNMVNIVDHSFEGVPKGQKSMAFFMKQNMDALRKKIAVGQQTGQTTSDIYCFTPLGSNEFFPNDYLIASGQLPTINPVVPGVDHIMEYALLAGLEGDTYQDICDAYGLQRGDQLTFVQILYGGLSGTQFKFARVILDPRNTDGTEAPMSSVFGLDNAPALPNSRNEGSFDTLAYEDGAWKFRLKNLQVWASAIIVSRKGESDEWMRSKSTMVSHINMAESGYGYSLEGAIEESMYGLTLGSDRYLNNAGVGSFQNPHDYQPAVTKITIGANEFDTPKSWEGVQGDTNFTIAGIVATDLDPSKTYKLKVERTDGQQLGNDIAISAQGTITSTQFTGVLNQVYNVNFYEGSVKKSTIATISLVESQAPPEGGGFGG